MKHLRNRSSLAMFLPAFVMFLLTLLLSVPALAVVPEQGLYEKRNETGLVTARMYVTARNGKGEMAVAAKELCLTLEALDANGSVTEQVVSDYLESPINSNGVGLEGFRLTDEDLRHSQIYSESFPRFYPKRFSVMWGGQHIEFNVPGDRRVNVRNCGENLDGSYVLNAGKECFITLPALIFTYEKTYCPKQYDYKHEPKGYYALEREGKVSDYHAGRDYVLHVNNPPREDHWNLITDHQMHVVMENRYNDYRFLFVRDNYPEWIESVWNSFAGSELADINMLYLHQYITRNAPELLENPAVFFRVTDTYKGKADIVTWVVDILQKENNGETKLGSALVGNNAVIQLRKGVEPLNVKKIKTKEKKKKAENKK